MATKLSEQALRHKYHIVQTGPRSWKLAHWACFDWPGDIDLLVFETFGITYRSFSYALQALRELREDNVLTEVGLTRLPLKEAE